MSGEKDGDFNLLSEGSSASTPVASVVLPSSLAMSVVKAASKVLRASVPAPG